MKTTALRRRTSISPRFEPIITLPWPARMWKPQFGAVERGLARSLRWRFAVSALTVLGLWGWVAFHSLRGTNTREGMASACVIGVFLPLMLLLVYPRLRRQEVRLPFAVEMHPNGFLFKLDETVWVDWEGVDAYSFCASPDPCIKRLEVLVSKSGSQAALVFPYDPQEIDEDLLAEVLAENLPGRRRRTICSIDAAQMAAFPKN